MRKVLLLLCCLSFLVADAQRSGINWPGGFYINGPTSINAGKDVWPPASAAIKIGRDSSNLGAILPRVVHGAVVTTERGVFFYDYSDSTLHHMDGSVDVRYMTDKDTNLIKTLIQKYAPGGGGGGQTLKAGYGINIDGDTIRVDTSDFPNYLVIADTAQALRSYIINVVNSLAFTSSKTGSVVTITMSNGASVSFNIADKDSSNTNEIQTLSIIHDTIFLSGSGFVKLPVETDPVFASSAASSITNTQIADWDAAYSWGNHAAAGYAKQTDIKDSLQGFDLQKVLDNGNTATNQKIMVNTHTSLDSFGLHITGDGRSVGIDIYNPDDTSTNGELNIAHLRIRNSVGKGWDLRTYSNVYTDYAVLFSDVASGYGLQGNGYNDLKMWRSVGGGTDYFFVDHHDNSSLNIVNDEINHMAFSNHTHNLYVNGNVKFNQAIYCNDSGRGSVYFFARPYNDGDFTRDVGFIFETLTSSNTAYKAFQITGDGDAYLQKGLSVGTILSTDTPVGIMNVMKTSPTDNRPLLYIDRGSNTIGNVFELWSYYKTLRAKMDAYGNTFVPSLYLTSVPVAGTTPDSVIISDRANNGRLTYVPAPFKLKSDSTTGTGYKTRNSAKQDSIALANQITAAVLGDTLLYNSKYLKFMRQNISYGWIDSVGDTVFRIADHGHLAIGKNASPTPDSSAWAPGIGITIRSSPGYIYPYHRFIFDDGTNYNDVSMGIDNSSFSFWPKTSALTNYQWFLNGTRIFQIQTGAVVSYKTLLANAALQAPNIPAYSTGSFDFVVRNSTNSAAFEKFSLSQLRTALAPVDSFTVINDSLYEWKSGSKKFRYKFTAGTGGVASVTASLPLSSSGGSNPNVTLDTTTTSGGWHSYNYYKTVFANITHTHAETDITNLTTDLAGKAALSHTHGMSDLTGFNITTPSDGQLVKYDFASGKWVNFTPGYLTSVADATTSTKGIASFSSTNFSVTSGAVSIKTGGVGSTEIADGSVALTDMANMTSGNVIGRNTAGTGAPEVLSMTTLKTMLSIPASGTLVAYTESSTASSATPAPTGDARENYYDITALAASATFAAPSGTPANHNSLLVRVKDNGTARTLAWNAIYRAGTDFALPTTTVIGKTMYVQFVYNSADSKWDCTGLTQGF